MATKGLKKYSTSLVIREMRIKTTVKYHYTPIKMAKPKKTDHIQCRETGTLMDYRWECKMYNHFGKQFGSFLRS